MGRAGSGARPARGLAWLREPCGGMIGGATGIVPGRRREASDSRVAARGATAPGPARSAGTPSPDVDNRRVHDPHEHGRSRGGASYVVGGYSPNQPTPARTNESGLNNRGTTAATRLARRPLGGQRIYRLAGDAWDGPPKARHSFRSSGMRTHPSPPSYFKTRRRASPRSSLWQLQAVTRCVHFAATRGNRCSSTTI
jgi:hypothetical protein